MSELRSSPRDTRGEILALLCGRHRTVSHLAQELRISNNSVRAQLERLEGDGLVRHEVVRQGIGKPAHEYQLTAAGSLRLSRAYLPLLSGLLTVSEERIGADQEEALLRETGRMLAQHYGKPDGRSRVELDAAVDLLGQLGGSSTVREDESVRWIEGACCPLHALIPEHPLACKAIEAMLTEFLGLPIREACDKRDPPSCRLFIGAAEELR